MRGLKTFSKQEESKEGNSRLFLWLEAEAVKWNRQSSGFI